MRSVSMERLNLECDGSVTHATRRSEGSQGCREDTDNELNDGLPSFLFHDDAVLRVKQSLIFNFPLGFAAFTKATAD